MSPVISQANHCVLLIHTDESFTQKASLDLQDQGYNTVCLSDLSQGWHHIEKLHPSMIVLDYPLTGEWGLKFCRELRNQGLSIPVLILLEQATVDHRVACLLAGADDYLQKPYHSKAFLQLINLYLQPTDSNSDQLCFGDSVLDLTSRCLFRHDQKIDLTMKEFELLKYLMSNPQEVLTREQILENVWGYNFRGESNVIEVYIRYLRLKIETEGYKRLIYTVRGVGYVLRES